MPRKVRFGAVALLVVALVAVAAVVGARAWRSAHRTDLQQAIALAPADAARFSFTDWAGVRRAVGADLDASSSGADVSDFLDEAYDRDLTSTSALVDSSSLLQEKFGFSPATVSWELFGQGSDGASILMKVPDDTSFDAIADRLEALGYDRPGTGDLDGGVWKGGEELVAQISQGQGLSPEVQYVALLADQHLVVTSDTQSYTAIAVSAADGDDSPVQGLDGVTAAAGDALAAAVYTGDNACAALAMSQADDSDRAEADQLVAEAGDVDPLTAFAMSSLADGTLRVAMGFSSSEQARTNADSRARLAEGPAVGQGGDFSDRFSLVRASADGDVVTLDLEPEPDTFVLSDLSTGPVLYATC